MTQGLLAFQIVAHVPKNGREPSCQLINLIHGLCGVVDAYPSLCL
jgi:hypothetical protein